MFTAVSTVRQKPATEAFLLRLWFFRSFKNRSFTGQEVFHPLLPDPEERLPLILSLSSCSSNQYPAGNGCQSYKCCDPSSGDHPDAGGNRCIPFIRKRNGSILLQRTFSSSGD